MIGTGTEDDPIRNCFSGVLLERSDKQAAIGICERDNGYEINITNKNGIGHRYHIDEFGRIIDSENKYSSAEKVTGKVE